MEPHANADADLLAGLNDPQRQAVAHIDGPLLVLAGPGSGKTRVITHRAAHLVRSGVASRHILCITFTNKAAGEMLHRIQNLGVARGMWVCTFHALGVRLLREFGPLVNVQPGFSIYDEADALKAVKNAMQITHITDAILRPDAIASAISDAKAKLWTPEEYERRATRWDDQAVAKVYRTYQKLLEQHNAVDFDDLLMKVALVLQQRADITERLNIRFRYVLVDEYQDTNHAQYLIARQLSKHHRNLCVTGDPDQSIYAWRGADIRNILEFERDYPEAVIVRLEQNYRSTGHILKCASQLIALNRRRRRKDLWTQLGEGEHVRAWEFAEGREEAEKIAATIAEEVRSGRKFNDFAIFYRVNAVSRGLEEALRDRAIPYKIARGVEYYNRREVRDALAYLRVIANPADDVALLRIINTPARGIGKTTVERLADAAQYAERPVNELLRDAGVQSQLGAGARKVQAFAELLERLRRDLPTDVAEAVGWVIAESGLEKSLREADDVEGEDRLANVQELVTAATRYAEDEEEPTLAGFLNRVSLVSDQDAVDESAGVVMLMTLHAAKGLEFPVVFIVGMEQGLLPHERALGGTGDIEEERRLCFVGLTRARELLVVAHASERIIRGQILPRSPSQFLAEIDGPSVEHEDFRPRFVGRLFSPSRPDIVPIVDDLPFDEASRLAPKRKLADTQPDDEFAGERHEDQRTRRDRDDEFASERHEDQRKRRDREDESAGDPTRFEHIGGRRKPSLKRKLEPTPDDASKFADWKPGTLVKHKQYGVGQVVWIKPAPGQTRACLKFAGYGEKTLILEFAPVERLDRRNSGP